MIDCRVGDEVEIADFDGMGLEQFDETTDRLDQRWAGQLPGTTLRLRRLYLPAIEAPIQPLT